MLILASGALSASVGLMLLIHTFLLGNNWTSFEAGALCTRNIYRH